MLSGLGGASSAGPASPIDGDAVVALQGRTAQLADAIRHISHELHPGVLSTPAWSRPWRSTAPRSSGITACRYGSWLGDEVDSLPFDAALCLYRVTQEALTNIVRHARARTAAVDLRRVRSRRSSSTSVDDGIGFVASERAGSGLGLRSIDERVRIARGHVSVDSQPGKGTNLVVRILSASLAEEVELR